MSNAIPKQSRETVYGRDGYQCQNCGQRASDYHHRRTRAVHDKHTHCPCNAVYLCHGCHMWMHEHVEDARKLGMIVSRYEAEPESVPVVTWQGVRWFRCYGAAEFTDPNLWNGLELLHYSKNPVLEPYPVSQRQWPGMKPEGLWLSVGDAWKQWNDREEFLTAEYFENVFRVRLKRDANVLLLDTAEALNEFTARLSSEDPNLVMWKLLEDSFDGVVVAPYRDRRELRAPWLYTWDFASGCLWEPGAVEKITLL